MINFDQDRDAANTPLSEHLLDPSYKLSRYALTTSRWVNHETVHVAAPPVVRPEQCADDVVPEHRQQKDGPWICGDTTYLFDFISNADARARLFPEPKNPFCVVLRCVPELHTNLRTSVVREQFGRGRPHVLPVGSWEFGSGWELGIWEWLGVGSWALGVEKAGPKDRPNGLFLREQLLHFVHHLIHPADGQIERLVGRHVHARVLQQIDRVFRSA